MTNKENNKYIKLALERLYEIEYNAIAENPDDYVTNRALSYSEKMETLSSILAHYVSLDEFEKCSEIHKVIERIKSEFNESR